jgi:O-antigen ligase
MYGLMALAVTVGLALLALRLGLGLEGVAGASVAGFVVFAAAVLRLDVREAGFARPGRFVAMALLPVVWCTAAVAVAGRLPGHDARSTAAALALYALLLLPLSPTWRTEWRRLRP